MKSILLPLCVAFILNACATIVSKSSWPVEFNSNMHGAALTITNSSGRIIYEGSTPATVRLDGNDAGYFEKPTFVARFHISGQEPKEVPITFKVNGWYWGNILIPGFQLLGLFIVDPLTGSMYRVRDEEVVVNFDLDGPSAGLEIRDYRSIPEDLRCYLVRLH